MVEKVLSVISVQQIVMYLGIILITVGFAYLVYKVMSGDEDYGKDVIKKIKNKQIMLLEIILGYMNFVEAFIAASVISTAGHMELAFAPRLGMHIAIALAGTIPGLMLFSQVRQWINEMKNSPYLFNGAIDSNTKFTITWRIIKQGIDVVATTFFAIAAPMINVYLVSRAFGEHALLWNPFNWPDMNPILLGTVLVTLLHILIVPYLGSLSSDEFIGEFVVIEGRPEKKPNPKWEDVAGYFAKHLGVDVTEVYAWTDTDPMQRYIRRGQLQDIFFDCKSCKDTLESTETAPDEKQKAYNKMAELHQKAATMLGVTTTP